MQIGEVIRKYRKEKNMTQEQMANRLGVTAPAVNKWENGNSLPDIMLLAPIARLLGISLDTLLSFRENLTPEEANALLEELREKMKTGSYDASFRWAKEQLELYPNCEHLILWMAQLLDSWRVLNEVDDAEKYDTFLCECYERILSSKEEGMRNAAADSLFGFYFRKEEYEKAEEYLSYLSKQNPERKRKQAQIYSKTNRMEEAYKAYEELLFSGYQEASVVFNSLYMLAMEQMDTKRAHVFVEKQKELARTFDMGEYHGIAAGLELAAAERDADTTLELMERMLASVGGMDGFRESVLYEHMTFKPLQVEFVEEMKKTLQECFRDEEKFGFLKCDKRWREIVADIR